MNRKIKDGRDFIKYHPQFQFNEDDYCMIGRVVIYDLEQKPLNDYLIKIELTKNYPFEFPQVYELESKLIRNIDWHIYSDGKWCLGTEIDEKIACSKGPTILETFNSHIQPFLFAQEYKKENGVFFMERSHGDEGRFESIIEHLNLKDEKIKAKAYALLKDKQEIKANEKCFCNSNRKYRKCHRHTIRVIKKIISKK